jgi:hypothetical protein
MIIIAMWATFMPDRETEYFPAKISEPDSEISLTPKRIIDTDRPCVGKREKPAKSPNKRIIYEQWQTTVNKKALFIGM